MKLQLADIFARRNTDKDKTRTESVRATLVETQQSSMRSAQNVRDSLPDVPNQAPRPHSIEKGTIFKCDLQVCDAFFMKHPCNTESTCFGVSSLLMARQDELLVNIPFDPAG